MRQIKFRAWDKKRNQMLGTRPYKWQIGINIDGSEGETFFNEFDTSKDGYADCETGKSVFLTFDGNVIGLLPVSESETQTVNYSDEYELMQFTGLHDKNGKEIYEGDVIREDGGDLWLVEWKDCGFYCRNITGLEDVILAYEFIDCEVIGNIFQDKHLLDD